MRTSPRRGGRGPATLHSPAREPRAARRGAAAAAPPPADLPGPRTENRTRARRGDRGLATLEWLIVVSVVAAFAGSAALVVERVLEERSEVPADLLLQITLAEIRGAELAAEAQAIYDSDPQNYTQDLDKTMRDRCETFILTEFDTGIASQGAWTSPRPNHFEEDKSPAPAICFFLPGPLLLGG
ncbi:MAG: hypothetical protein F4110_07775 [Acidimicrobiaceae bacterium]|nr:hypothetical protein [Acidimicrobiaceae bacterium]MYE96475.1 hypothetical protein [Acidimicrobiaceae bacterium]MYI53862.1 hypothetical protein [Acidimicrobiaceae bacterium]